MTSCPFLAQVKVDRAYIRGGVPEINKGGVDAILDQRDGK